MTIVEFQGRTFSATPAEGGLYQVRYLIEGRNITGYVKARTPERLAALLAVQSGAMDGAQLLPIEG